MTEESYDRRYFESDDQTRGYRNEGYRDFAVHHAVAKSVLTKAPKSVIELGAGRGYITKIIKNEKIPVLAIDVSPHCWHTRALDEFALWDITKTPWLTPVFPVHGTSQNGVGLQRVRDRSFDLCFSIALLEHIPEDKIDDVIREMARVSNRGYHAISVPDTHPPEWWSEKFKHLAPPGHKIVKDPREDESHAINVAIEWWGQKFKRVCPDYPVEIVDKEELERYGDIREFIKDVPHETREAGHGKDGLGVSNPHLKKINFGSFINMFYYGWTNVDILDMDAFAASQAFKFLRLDASKPLPFPDEYAELIFASHLIEHMSREEGVRWVRECFRILKPGGMIRIATPNTESLMSQYAYDMGKYEDHLRDYKTAPDDDTEGLKQYRHVNPGVEQAETPLDAFAHIVLSGHKAVYDIGVLYKILIDAGFEDNMLINNPFRSEDPVMERETIVSHPTLSAVIEARKPIPKPAPKPEKKNNKNKNKNGKKNRRNKK